MRTWCVVSLVTIVGVSTVVGAPPERVPTPKLIEQLVTKNLAGKFPGPATNLAKDAMVIVGDFRVDPTDPESRLLLEYENGEATYKPGRWTIGFDDKAGFAWFQLPYTVHRTSLGTDLNPQPDENTTERIGGVAVRSASGWELAVLAHSHLRSDKDLLEFNERSTMPSGPPQIRGDAAVARVVVSWVGSGLAPHAATKRGTSVVVSGTSPKEQASGRSVATLVKSWDRLGLAVQEVDAKVLAGGAVAVAVAKVLMPKRKTKRAIAMGLVVVMVRDGAGWKWVSLQFSA